MDKAIGEFAVAHGGYWEGECPQATLENWRTEVANEDTRLGYWEWAWYATQGDEVL